MLAEAFGKYIRMSPKKARLVVDLLKGKNLEEADFILDNINKGAAPRIQKVVRSAFANANNGRQDKLTMKEVYISAITVDGGPYYMRYRAATMGRATPIRHRTSHVHVVLDEVAAGADSKVENNNKQGVK